jgi:hypothetical protein
MKEVNNFLKLTQLLVFAADSLLGAVLYKQSSNHYLLHTHNAQNEGQIDSYIHVTLHACFNAADA